MEASGKRYIVHGSKTDEFRIWNLADLHLMSAACAEEKLQADIDAIHDDPHSFWLGGGDYAECISYKDKRFDPDSVDRKVTVQELGEIAKAGYERVRDLFAPIKHKCLGLLMGNHEKTLELHTQQSDRTIWLCNELGVPNLRYCAMFDLIFARRTGVRQPKLRFEPTEGRADSRTFRVFCHHGAGFATTPGGKLNKLIQFMNSFDADMYFCGHVHDQVGRRQVDVAANDDCTKLQERVRLGVISGSYLKTYSQGITTYAEQRGYAPVTLGAAFVKIKPYTRELRGEI